MVRRRLKWPELRAWLAETGSTQADLAALVGCSQAFVCRLLKGHRSCGPATAMRISLATGIPVEKLMTAKGAQVLKLLSTQQARAGKRVAS